MAQNVDMTNLEAQLTSLGAQVEFIAQMLQRGPGESSEESITEERLDELNDFTANIKQATIQLRSYGQRWHNATIVKSEDVRGLERREEEIEHKKEVVRQKQAYMAEQEELQKAKAADISKEGELLKAKAADISKEEELLKAKAAEIAKKEELLEQKTRERDAEMKDKASKLNEREALI